MWKRHGIACELEGDEQLNVTDEEIKISLFRVSRELLMNVIKHAQARKVKVSIHKRRNQVHIVIQDDGVGFDSDNIGGIPGHGLSNMAVRTQSLGGNLTVSSAPGDGTSVQAVIPIHAPINVPPRLVSFP